jgi:hypothetical protein
MSWLARCRDQLVSRIHEFFLLWFEAYGRISPLPLSNFPENEHEEVRLSPPRLVDEDTYPPYRDAARSATVFARSCEHFWKQPASLMAARAENSVRAGRKHLL